MWNWITFVLLLGFCLLTTIGGTPVAVAAPSYGGGLYDGGYVGGGLGFGGVARPGFGFGGFGGKGVGYGHGYGHGGYGYGR